ncbi:cytidine deaminase-like [Ruditapes philippinarum]|uniref:cytidine deaminase-like n=1 Tax=Ruditapes philippinarum TaxID=129788 RepID=UPI00295B4581|nr:cytidine deaminase-like [Ruditapes philippinarum]
MDISSLDAKFQELIKAAVDVKNNAYCPYSNFRVGASVLCTDGSIYAGCNVENASYGLCVCAERNAVMKAVSEGKMNFVAAAVSCDIKGDFKGPCGVCRQVFAEFNLDLDLYLTKPDMTYKKVVLRELLPMAFTPKSLEEERI